MKVVNLYFIIIELSDASIMDEVRKIINEYEQKRSKDIEECKNITHNLLTIKDSVKNTKEIPIPYYFIPEKMKEAAKLFKDYFDNVPDKALLCSASLAPHFLRLVTLEKVAIFTTKIQSKQKLPSVYMADYKGKKVIIIDLLQEGEDRYPEQFPTLTMRVLILSGIKKFAIITEVYGVEPNIKMGEVVLFDNYIPLNVVSPFIGRYCNEWSEQFLDVAEIFSSEKNRVIKEEMEKVVLIRRVNVAWVNSNKTYVDTAELKLGEGLRVPIITTQGITQSLVAFDMKKEFFVLGIVNKNLNYEESLTDERRRELAEKLINILSVEF